MLKKNAGKASRAVSNLLTTVGDTEVETLPLGHVVWASDCPLPLVQQSNLHICISTHTASTTIWEVRGGLTGDD